MDPYVSFTYNKREYHTKIMKNAGSEATWNEIIVIDVDSLKDELHIRCIDKDFMLDDLIGETKI